MRMSGVIWLTVALAAKGLSAEGRGELPTEWIDPTTGHRVVRLSQEDGSQSWYFHQSEFTPDGKRLVFGSRTGLYTVDLETRKIEQIRARRGGMICVGRKTGLVYYLARAEQGTAIFVVDPNTKEDKKIVDVPEGASIANINCDETLAGGTFDLQRPRVPSSTMTARGESDVATAGTPGGRTAEEEVQQPSRRPGFGRSDADRDMQLVTIDLKSGEVRKFNESHAWLNHVQFSPTDPQQMLYCHEGTWELMDRTWIIRTDGEGPLNVHPRTMNMEINGHEFFSPDGKGILYDLQTPRSVVFWVARYDIETHRRTWYHLKQSEWSVHYNISPDQKLFCGDGGGPRSVAAPDNGQWIYLFRPRLTPPVTGGASDPATLIQTGTLDAERLVNMANHNYTLEPNCQFTPDGKWIVFRSNMLGPTHVFEVEVAKAGNAGQKGL
jgi:oligogalacturonide lyase